MISRQCILNGFRFLFKKRPTILSEEQTILRIKESGCSIARFGDGEMTMMSNGGISFEDYSPEKTLALRNAFQTRDSRVLICLTGAYNIRTLIGSTNDVRDYYKNFILGNYHLHYPSFDKKYEYGEALITRFYMDWKNKKDSVIMKKVERLRSLWDKRSLLIVEGSESRLGVGNNLFDNAKSIRRIICPSRNAMDNLGDIETAILDDYRPNDLIIMALGPAASVLCTKLPIEHDMQCLDLGHIDVEYIWWQKHVTKKTMIVGKHAAEARGNQTDDIITLDTNLEAYNKEIVAYVASQGCTKVV